MAEGINPSNTVSGVENKPVISISTENKNIAETKTSEGFFVGRAVRYAYGTLAHSVSFAYEMYKPTKDPIEYLSKWNKLADKIVGYNKEVEKIIPSDNTKGFFKVTKILGPLQMPFAVSDLAGDIGDLSKKGTATKVKAAFNGFVHFGDICDYASTFVDLSKSSLPTIDLVVISEKVAVVFQFTKKLIEINAERVHACFELVSVKFVVFQDFLKYYGFTNSIILLGLKVRQVWEVRMKEVDLNEALRGCDKEKPEEKLAGQGYLCKALRKIWEEKKSWTKLLSIQSDSKFEKVLESLVLKFEHDKITTEDVYKAEALLKTLQRRIGTEYTFLAIDLANKVISITGNVLKMTGVGLPVAYGLFVINATVSLVVWHRKPVSQDSFKLSIGEEGSIDAYLATKKETLAKHPETSDSKPVKKEDDQPVVESSQPKDVKNDKPSRKPRGKKEVRVENLSPARMNALSRLRPRADVDYENGLRIVR